LSAGTARPEEERRSGDGSVKKNPKTATFDYHLTMDLTKWPKQECTPKKMKQLHDEIQKVFCQTLADEFGFERIFVRDCDTGQFKGTVVENGDLVGRLMDRRTRYLKIEECCGCPRFWVCIQTHKVGKPHHIPRSCPLPNFGKLTGRE
jgi:hypothetical protein